MNGAEWEELAATLAERHGRRISTAALDEAGRYDLACPTPEHVRRALIETYLLLRDAPTSIQQRFKKIAEATLRDLAVEVEGSLETSSLAWSDGDIVIAAAAQVRALDHFLFVHSEQRGKPSDPATAYLCPTTHMHAVPRPFAIEPEAADIGTTTFRRRALVWHRIIPEKVGDYTIDLHWYRDLSLSMRRDDAKVVGSLFDGLSLTPDAGFERFVAAAAPCTDEDTDLDHHVRAAYEGTVVLALWPELTMPPDRREKLAGLLRERAISAAPGAGPGIVAAGSWHEVSGSLVYNRMHILSALGRPRFHHDKTLPMESKDLGVEQLTPSYRIPVLITEDTLIAFAICRDFCEGQIARIYIELDVDLVVVPSYGDERTMAEHRQRAHDLSTDPGTRTFVVQQIVPHQVTAGGVGYMLPPKAEIATIAVSALKLPAPSKAFPLSFKRV